MVSDTKGKDSDQTSNDKAKSLRVSRRNLIIAGGVGAAVIVVGGVSYFLAAAPGQPQQETTPTPTAPTPAPTPRPSAPRPAPTPAPAPAPQMSAMDKMIEAAKKEGQVVIYTDSTPRRLLEGKLDKAFTEKYGIEAKYVAGRGTALIKKYMEEVKAGQPIADVVALTDAPMLDGQKGGYFAEFKNAEYGSFREQRSKNNDLFFYGSSISSTIAYNTNLVKEEDVPTKWIELTDPKWKGKIMTPMSTTLSYYLLNIHGENYIKALKKNEVKVNPNFSAARELVSTGAFHLLLGTGVGNTISARRQGAPLDFKIIEDPAAWGALRGIALSKTATHSNAGKLWYNWFMTKEILKPYWESYPTLSFRIDLPTNQPKMKAVKKFIWNTDPELFGRYVEGANKARAVTWGIFGITRRRR